MEHFVNGPKLLEKISKSLNNTKKADFAVAFWGAGACDRLGIKRKTKAKIRIVCNLSHGGTNPNEIEKLINYGANVRQLNDLHSKIGVTDDLSFLGSSNMSTYGLGLEGIKDNWKEANVLYDNPHPNIKEIFEEYWHASQTIKKEDIEKAKINWIKKIESNFKNSESNISDLFDREYEFLDNFNIFVFLHTPVTGKEEKTINDKCKIINDKYGNISNAPFNIYMDLYYSIKNQSLPKNNDFFIIDFEWSKHSNIINGDLHKLNLKEFPIHEDKEGSFFPSRKVQKIEEIKVDSKGRQSIKYALKKYIESEKNIKVGDNILLKLSWLKKYTL